MCHVMYPVMCHVMCMWCNMWCVMWCVMWPCTNLVRSSISTNMESCPICSSSLSMRNFTRSSFRSTMKRIVNLIKVNKSKSVVCYIEKPIVNICFSSKIYIQLHSYIYLSSIIYKLFMKIWVLRVHTRGNKESVCLSVLCSTTTCSF